jgi:hypothetical protein
MDPVLKKGEVDRNYPFLFKLFMVKREMILGAKTQTDRAMWISAFNVLFEFRDM